MTGHWLGTEVPLTTQHSRPKGMGLHICAVVRQGTSSSSEYVEVVNDGAEPVAVTGLELTDGSDHVYWFPEGDLGPGVTAYVYTESGKNRRMPTGDMILHAGLPASVWKDDSHVAHLRHPDGRIIDTMHAGRPARHPYGH
ncbi:MAG TPA: lamin tail domain-containing protein [Gaiellaceae bacterium]